MLAHRTEIAIELASYVKGAAGLHLKRCGLQLDPNQTFALIEPYHCFWFETLLRLR